MRRFRSVWFIIAGCCTVCAIGGSASFGRDDLRTSMFRALTSEQPAGPAMDQTPTVNADGPQSASLPTLAAPQNHAAAPTIARPTVSASGPRLASFHGGNSARQTMSQFPHRAAIRTNPRRGSGRQAKPFENVEHEPTISPYLNLDRDDDDSQNVPNYLTLVVPQFEQIQTNRLQQREIQQLRGQLQNAPTNVGVPPAYDTSRSAGMGSPARFMDTAQFYGGLRQ